MPRTKGRVRKAKVSETKDEEPELQEATSTLAEENNSQPKVVEHAGEESMAVSEETANQEQQSIQAEEVAEEYPAMDGVDAQESSEVLEEGQGKAQDAESAAPKEAEKEEEEVIVRLKPMKIPGFINKAIIEKWEWHMRVFPIDQADIRTCVLDSVSKIAQETWMYIDKQNYNMGAFDLCMRNSNDAMVVMSKLLKMPLTYRYVTVELTRQGRKAPAGRKAANVDQDEEEEELPYTETLEQATLLLDYVHTATIERIKGKEMKRSLYVKYLPENTSKELVKVLFPTANNLDILTTGRSRRYGELNVSTANNVLGIYSAYVTIEVNGCKTITLEWKEEKVGDGKTLKRPTAEIPWEIIPRNQEYQYELVPEMAEDETVRFQKKRRDYSEMRRKAMMKTSRMDSQEGEEMEASGEIESPGSWGGRRDRNRNDGAYPGPRDRRERGDRDRNRRDRDRDVGGDRFGPSRRGGRFGGGGPWFEPPMVPDFFGLPRFGFPGPGGFDGMGRGGRFDRGRGGFFGDFGGPRFGNRGNRFDGMGMAGGFDGPMGMDGGFDEPGMGMGGGFNEPEMSRGGRYNGPVRGGRFEGRGGRFPNQDNDQSGREGRGRGGRFENTNKNRLNNQQNSSVPEDSTKNVNKPDSQPQAQTAPGAYVPKKSSFGSDKGNTQSSPKGGHMGWNQQNKFGNQSFKREQANFGNQNSYSTMQGDSQSSFRNQSNQGMQQGFMGGNQQNNFNNQGNTFGMQNSFGNQQRGFGNQQQSSMNQQQGFDSSQQNLGQQQDFGNQQTFGNQQQQNFSNQQQNVGNQQNYGDQQSYSNQQGQQQSYSTQPSYSTQQQNYNTVQQQGFGNQQSGGDNSQQNYSTPQSYNTQQGYNSQTNYMDSNQQNYSTQQNYGNQMQNYNTQSVQDYSTQGQQQGYNTQQQQNYSSQQQNFGNQNFNNQQNFNQQGYGNQQNYNQQQQSYNTTNQQSGFNNQQNSSFDQTSYNTSNTSLSSGGYWGQGGVSSSDQSYGMQQGQGQSGYNTGGSYDASAATGSAYNASAATGSAYNTPTGSNYNSSTGSNYNTPAGTGYSADAAYASQGLYAASSQSTDYSRNYPGGSQQTTAYNFAQYTSSS